MRMQSVVPATKKTGKEAHTHNTLGSMKGFNARIGQRAADELARQEEKTRAEKRAEELSALPIFAAAPPVRMESRTERQCAFTTDGVFCCGDPTRSRSVYCEHHHALVYRPAPALKVRVNDRSVRRAA